MTNKTYFFYDKVTGVFNGATYSGPDEYLQQQLSFMPTMAAFEGLPDISRQRFDIATKALVAKDQPVRPANTDTIEYVWDDKANNWTGVQTLDLVKTYAKQTIDSEAGETRARFLTDILGQVEAYQKKAEEAAAYLADNTTQPGPYLQAEATALNTSLQDAATRIVDAQRKWDGDIGPAIEGIRVKGKADVDSAADRDAVAGVRSGVENALRAL